MPTTLRGDKELLKTFARLVGPEMGKGKLRALQEGLGVMEKKVKQNYERLSTTIPRAVASVARVYNNEQFFFGIIGIDSSKLRDIRFRKATAVHARGPRQSTDLSPFAQKALLLEFGADPHLIEPVDPILDDPRNVLMDWSPSLVKVFGSRVSHPGTRPKAPMRRAFNSTVSAAREAEIRQLSLEIDRIALTRQEKTFGLSEKTIII